MPPQRSAYHRRRRKPPGIGIVRRRRPGVGPGGKMVGYYCRKDTIIEGRVRPQCLNLTVIFSRWAAVAGDQRHFSRPEVQEVIRTCPAASRSWNCWHEADRELPHALLGRRRAVARAPGDGSNLQSS